MQNDAGMADDYTMAEALSRAASALRKVAVMPDARALVRRAPVARRLFDAAGRRFVAADRARAIALATELHRNRIAVSLDFIGEDVESPEEIEDAVREFVELAASLAALDLEASLSVNLSHIGLTLDRELAAANCERIAGGAGAAGAEVILNMEGDRYRGDILETYWRLGTRFPNLGITLQACLPRTSDDLARCLALPGRIRLVKGAYDELGPGGGIRSRAVQDRYGQLTERLLQSGHRCAIATHDAEFLTRAADRITPGRDRTVEFEMLFGVARRRLEWLRDRGYPVRVYLPYGGGSFLYVCHRLAEHPPNVLLAAADAAEELRLLASGAQL